MNVKDHIISQAVDSGFVILVEKKMPNYTILKAHNDCPYLNILYEDKLLSILSYLNISCNSKTSKDLKKVIDGIKFEDKNFKYRKSKGQFEIFYKKNFYKHAKDEVETRYPFSFFIESNEKMLDVLPRFFDVL